MKFKDDIEKVINELLEMGHITRSSITFASFMVFLKKKDGTMKMCIDYRALSNKIIKIGITFPRSMRYWMSYMGKCNF
jgi:hypothetical protein